MDSNKVTYKKHPQKHANFLSNIFFCWTVPIFYKGLKKDLNEYDLCQPLKKHESKRLGDEMQKSWLKEIETKKSPSLWRAIWNVFKVEIILCGILLFFMEIVLKLVHPIALSKLMLYYVPNQSSIGKNEAYLYASLIVLASFLNVMMGHSYMMIIQNLGMRMRIACCSLIYRKSLNLSNVALAETTIGQMVNLLSNDVGRLDSIMLHFHNIWTGPIQIVIVTYLLYRMVGLVSVVAAIFFLGFIPLNLYMGGKTSQYRMKTAVRTDERIRLMNEIIRGIQLIKMYTWEMSFTKLIEQARLTELEQIKRTSFIRAINFFFPVFVNRLMLFICVLTYVLSGNQLNAYYVFVITAFYNVLRQSMMLHLPFGIECLAETRISIRRLKNFLMYQEINYSDNSFNHGGSLDENVVPYNSPDEMYILQVNEICAKWISSIDNTLTDISFRLRPDETVAIVGPVGSGKTSLLHVLLKELPIFEGTLAIKGTISYASQEPWIFSGTIQQNILFGHEINWEKYNEVIKVCALEQDLHQLPHGDMTTVGERGVLLSGGQKARVNLARAIYKNADIYLLDDPLSAVDTHVGKQLFDKCILNYLKNKCVILVTHQLQYLQSVNKILVLENGRLESSGTFSELVHLGKNFVDTASDDVKEIDVIDTDNSIKRVRSNNENTREIKEHRATGSLNRHAYRKYLRAGGIYLISALVFLLFVITQVLASGVDYFIAFWVNIEEKNAANQSTANNTSLNSENAFFTRDNCIYIYTGIISSLIIIAFIRSFGAIIFCISASNNLHNQMFSSIVNAPMMFFNTNPSGRILNRFSKDIGSIDEALPGIAFETIEIGLNVLAISAVVASVNPWILIPTVIIFILFYSFRIVYLKTSRNLKRLEGSTRSPVFSHISTTLQGLTTIRAFSAQELLSNEFDNHQNLHSSAFYLFMGCNRTFGFWLDFHCVIYVALVTLSFLFLDIEMYGGNVGLAITQAIALTGMFQWGMRQWSELENQMTSVERVVEYTEIEQETDCPDVMSVLPKYWPDHGDLRFVQLSLKYSINEPYVLKHLNFHIQSKEKIGIVGRTGAGKSSIITALFRLTQIEGDIFIDGLNIKAVSLKDLRSRISIIPQDPVLFSGSLRRNLDPFDQYLDEELWNALEEVELKNIVAELPAGINSRMYEGGSNFSVGQRQLVCLARTIVRKNKIIILDEATANVDPHTDGLIQSTIKRKFVDCTVLTIAHRLHTVMDSDRILVMDAGNIVEFDHPFKLLQNSEGVLLDMVQQTGDSMAQNLLKIAQEVYKREEENFSGNSAFS